MVSVALFLLFDLVLCLALFDQTVWDGQSTELRILAQLLPTALFLALSVSQLRGKQQAYRTSISGQAVLGWVVVIGVSSLLALATFRIGIWWTVLVLALLRALLLLSGSPLAIPRPSILLTWLLPGLLLYAFCSQQSLVAHEALQGNNLGMLHIGLLVGMMGIVWLVYRELGRSSLHLFRWVTIMLPTFLVLLYISGTVLSELQSGSNAIAPISQGMNIAVCFVILGLRLSMPILERPAMLQRAELCIGWILLGCIAVHGMHTGYALSKVLPTPPKLAPALSTQFEEYLLTAEDPTFYFHRGVDFFRINDAIRGFLQDPSTPRGGSTISMQLVKVLTDDRDRTLWRKYVQTISALFLEMRWTKREILHSYLSVIPFAPGVVGIDLAALHFFKSTPALLDDEQSMQLVLSIYDPAHYNPAVVPMPPEVRRRRTVIRARAKRFSSRLHPS